MFQKLAGKKTYFVSAATLVLAGLRMFNVIDDTHYTSLVSVLAPLGVIALRSAIK